FGTIGLAWRRGEDTTEKGSRAETANDRVMYWGMTKSEAAKQIGHSYCCIAVKTSGAGADSDPLAILYFDAGPANAFSSDFAGRLAQETAFSDVAGKLSTYSAECLSVSPRLRLFAND